MHRITGPYLPICLACSLRFHAPSALIHAFLLVSPSNYPPPLLFLLVLLVLPLFTPFDIVAFELALIIKIASQSRLEPTHHNLLSEA